jgi:hypothetical protein
MKQTIRCLGKNSLQSVVYFCLLILLASFTNDKRESEYYVAAYIWPSCHNDIPKGQEILWPEGIGEWEIIEKGNPRFEGHYQPKQPLWGQEMYDDQKVMEKWINAATDHGVNVFIFDWYWYDEGPFLESSLNNGFLKAKNNEKMQFYIMWANRDVRRNYWNVHKYKEDDSIFSECLYWLGRFSSFPSQNERTYCSLQLWSPKFCDVSSTHHGIC